MNALHMLIRQIGMELREAISLYVVAAVSYQILPMLLFAIHM